MISISALAEDSHAQHHSSFSHITYNVGPQTLSSVSDQVSFIARKCMELSPYERVPSDVDQLYQAFCL